MKQHAHTAIYQNYVRHLPTVPLFAPAEQGHVYHLALLHAKRCALWQTGNLIDCDCEPKVRRHVEPTRS
jgi:hypothetical protein